MRRAFLILAMLLAVAGAVATTPRPAEAGPGSSNCFDRCECGTGYRCCTFDGVTTCKPSGAILCPQIACL